MIQARPHSSAQAAETGRLQGAETAEKSLQSTAVRNADLRARIKDYGMMFNGF